MRRPAERPGVRACACSTIFISLSRVLAIVLIVFLAAAAACRKASTPADSKSATPGGTPAAGGAAPAPAAPAPAPASPIPATLPPMPVPKDLPDVVARVNSEDIKRADFDLLVRNIEISNNASIPPDRRDEILRRALDDLLTYTVLKQEAKARKIPVSDAEVEERLQAMRKSAPSEEVFKAALAQRKMTLARLRADTRNEIAIAKMMNVVASEQPTTDAEAKAFYEKNPDRFKHPDLVRASHIMVRFEPAGGDAAKAKARPKAEALLKRARVEDFAELARQNSEHVSAGSGGDLGYFPREKPALPLPREFIDAAFALKPGEISDLVATENGYHIIKVIDRKPAGILPLADVNEQVKQGLTQQKTQAFVAQLKQKAKIEVLI
jgi:peptidyl-prolyl cis-trans isomerase C